MNFDIYQWSEKLWTCPETCRSCTVKQRKCAVWFVDCLVHPPMSLPDAPHALCASFPPAPSKIYGFFGYGPRKTRWLLVLAQN
jgi:hypothetical protein